MHRYRTQSVHQPLTVNLLNKFPLIQRNCGLYLAKIWEMKATLFLRLQIEWKRPLTASCLELRSAPLASSLASLPTASPNPMLDQDKKQEVVQDNHTTLGSCS